MHLKCGKGVIEKTRGDTQVEDLQEPEVIFQVNLIKRYKPNKIISVHAPLTIIDYDGPTRKNRNYKKASQLLIQMSRKASGYRIKNYPFFHWESRKLGRK